MKDYETFSPLHITKARGSFIYHNDKPIIDAISSWWSKSLGHSHPDLQKALTQQLDALEHTILANTTNTTIEVLTQKLCQLTHTDKALFASDGSCAVEIAMKMSIHARVIKGQSNKTHFVALQNGYHGETCATLSVSDLGLYKEAYQALLFDCTFLKDIPYVTGINDPLWHDTQCAWQKSQMQLEAIKDKLNAVIIEPLIQGAGGMLIYSKDYLSRLAKWCKENDIYLIADEIMTGIGRTGKMLACEHADITPDFICLSKGITSGMLPLSICLTHDDIYALFYDDYATQKAFMHSHTHSGNTLASRVALETLTIFERESILNYVNKTLAPTMHNIMLEIAQSTQKLHNIRSLGGVVAADLKTTEPRAGYKLYQRAIEKGALMRPLGNTIYWLPPLNTDIKTINKLGEILLELL
ncbi:adenosylmethionine--8-amino-7-oxononanoate aminotransferase BioA [Cysteiniphilum litorale]|uniref:adenosylmethionine--8-amino-7-oxononanoate transaminase n=2 Tax=Fastidiosibacteraceae TaxID=2056687 RepID=A0A8J2Z1Z9_9GAMM|nr:adenosylmethionine--8-amino-7-oxononanoate aminotransferase BioA [Cysteiniphilum litorale]